MNARIRLERARVLGCAAILLVLALGFAGDVGAQIQMPDPSLINGKALPANDLQTGTITVRVVRESIGNNVVGQQVTLTAGSITKTATTDEQGRAEFKGMTSGTEGHAETTVDGERLASDPFMVPGSGGLRVIMVAGLAKATERKKQEEAAAAAAPPVKGTVTLGGNSRIVFEFPDDLMRVYYMLEIVNTARTRVDIGGPLVFDLPTGAAGAAPLEGSSPQAVVNGDRVTVTGPFASGATLVQIGFQMPFTTSNLTFTQTWPVPLEQISVASQKLASLSLSSPQFTTVGDVTADNGTKFLLASGNALPAGGALTIDVSGLPVHSFVPRNVALAIAVAIALFGVWLARPGGSSAGQSDARLAVRRETLLSELARLEERVAGGRESAADATRRQRIVSELERIYGELDEVGPRGGGKGIAA